MESTVARLFKLDAIFRAGLAAKFNTAMFVLREVYRLALRGDGGNALIFWRTQVLQLIPARAQSGRCRLAARPSQIHLPTAPRAQSGKTAFRPYVRKRRQKAQLAVLALQQHLRHACRPAEISIDLEYGRRFRRMGIHQIWEGGLTQQHLQTLI